MTTTNRRPITSTDKQAVVLAFVGFLLAGVEIYFIISAMLYRGVDQSVLPGYTARYIAVAVLIWVIFLFGQGRGETKIREELDTEQTKLARARKQMGESTNPFGPKRFARVLLINAALIFSMNVYWDWNFALLIGLTILGVTLVLSYLSRLTTKELARERVEQALSGRGGAR